MAFALSRRPIILLSLGAFVVGGLIAFSKLNIEAYPNPAPVILEITAQAPGQSAEEMERYYTIPIEVGLRANAGSGYHSLDLVLWPLLRSGHIQVWD